MGCLVELYGAGLAEIVRILGEDAEGGPRLLDRLVADPLVESLLLVHDLHPLDAGTRVQRAIEPGSPPARLACGPVEYLGIDERASSTCAWSRAAMAAGPRRARSRRPSRNR